MKRLAVFVFILFFAVNVFAASQQTSSTTAGAIVDRAEVYLNDSSNNFWLATELLQWLNDGMIDIVARSHCLEGTESINLAADTLEYTITSTYLTVKSVHYVNASGGIKRLIKSSPTEVGAELDVDEPVYWYDWAGKIGAFPTLDSRTTETITVYYITRPTAIATGVNVTTPAIYDTALTYYIVAQAWMKDLKLNKYLQTMALYEREMDRIRRDLNEIAPKVVE